MVLFVFILFILRTLRLVTNANCGAVDSDRTDDRVSVHSFYAHGVCYRCFGDQKHVYSHCRVGMYAVVVRKCHGSQKSPA